MADASFTAFVREQLAALPEVEFRRMFGGQGIYLSDVFFGILYQGRLYFKTDAASRPDYEAADMEAFQPNAKQCLPPTEKCRPTCSKTLRNCVSGRDALRDVGRNKANRRSDASSVR